MLDIANNPGRLFVVATLLPLASFLFLLLCFGIRSALRSSKEGTAGASFYQLLGGDTPAKWPAWLATAAIGLACVCCVIGFVGYLRDHGKVTELEQQIENTQRARKELQAQAQRSAPLAA